MSINVEEMRAKLRLDAASFSTGIDDAQRSLSGLKDQISTISAQLDGLGKKLKGIGQGFTTKLTLPLVAGGAAAVKWASDLNEATSAVATVFGDSASKVLGSQGSVAKVLGVTREEALSTAVALGSLYTGMGLSADAAAGLSNEMLQAAADLGSKFNVPIEEAIDALRSGIVGESEPVKRLFGIIINESQVAAEAVRLGFSKTGKNLTEQQKVLARQSLIMGQLGSAQGDFANTSDQLDNKKRIVKVQFKDAAAQLGQQLLPLVLRATQWFSKLIERFNKLSPATKKWILIGAGIIAVIGPVLLILGHLATAIGVLMPVFAAIAGAISLPLLLIAGAIVLLAIAWKKNWGDIRGKTKSAIKFIRGVIDPFVGKFMSYTKMIRKGMLMIVDAFKKGGIKGAIGAIFGDAGKLILKGLGSILGLPARIIGSFLLKIKTGFAPLDAILHNVGKMFRDAGLLIKAIFSGEWGRAFKLAKRLFFEFIDQYKLIGEFLLAIFQAIPWGTIGTALFNGLVAAGTFMEETGYPWLWKMIKRLLKAIGGAIGDINWSMLEVKGRALLRGLLTGANGYWKDRLWPWIKGLPGKILGVFSDLPGQMWTLGTYVIQGLYDGLLTWWNSYLKPLIDWMVNLIPKRFRNALGIDSPSKVFAEIGKWSMRGIGVGFAKELPRILSKVGSFTTKVSDAALVGGGARLDPMPALAAAGGRGGDSGGARTFNIQKGAIVVHSNDGKKVAAEILTFIERVEQGQK